MTARRRVASVVEGPGHGAPVGGRGGAASDHPPQAEHDEGDEVGLRGASARHEPGRPDRTNGTVPTPGDAARDVLVVGEVADRLRELAHDLRQPLAAVDALASAAQVIAVRDEGPSAALTECLVRINEEVRQMLGLCRHLLDDAHDDELVSVRALAEHLVARVRSTTTCAVHLYAEPCRFRTDPVELARVLANLVDNAVRAAGPAGVVELWIAPTDGGLLIEVGDSGPGFGRGPTGACGIGHAVVLRYAAQHGGTVEVHTSRLGGAAVTLVLPVQGKDWHPALTDRTNRTERTDPAGLAGLADVTEVDTHRQTA